MATWANFSNGPIIDFTVHKTPDGHLRVFAVFANGSIFLATQANPDAGLTNSWNTWRNLGASAVAAPTVINDSQGLMHVFAVTPVGDLIFRRETGAPGNWAPWHTISQVSGPDQYAVAVGKTGLIEVFFMRAGALRYTALDPFLDPSAPTIATRSIEDPYERLFLARNADGRLELFMVAGEWARHAWQDAQGAWATDSNGLLASEAFLSGVKARSPGLAPVDFQIASNADGRLEVFARSTSDQIVHLWQTVPNGGWSQPESFGGTDIGDFALGVNSDGRLEIFGMQSGNPGANCVHRWQVTPNGGWSGWNMLPHAGALGGQAPVLATHGATNLNLPNPVNPTMLDVFCFSGGIVHNRQSIPNGPWAGWEALVAPGLPPPAPQRFDGLIKAARNSNSRIEVFARADGMLYHAKQLDVAGPWE